MNIPGLKGVIIENCEQYKERIVLHISMLKREHTCPACGDKTAKVHVKAKVLLSRVYKEVDIHLG